MDVREFQEKLKEMQTLARRQDNSLQAGQIRQIVEGTGLDRAQMSGVIRYLISQGISIEGAESGGAEPGNMEEAVKIPLTEEEKNYLQEYLREIPEPGDLQEEERLFRETADGSPEAARQLVNRYLRAAAELAVEMNMEEMFLGDLIQEANLCLMQAVGLAGGEQKDGIWLMQELRRGLGEICSQQKQQKLADDSLVARVEKLENAVRELSDDEEDGKNAFTVGELAVILDMDVEEIRDTLRLTGDDQ